MRLELAQSAGFCYGVRRAVCMAEAEAKSGRPCVMLGPIIHNRSVVDYLAGLGVGTIQTPEEAPAEAAVIIRSHGESRAIHEALAARGNPVVDATCPNVSRIHRIVSEAEEQGRQVVIIGTPTHPEVTAIAGWCRRPVVAEGAAELEQWLLEDSKHREKPLTMVAQTTSTRLIWESAVEKAKKLCTNSKIFDTICNATCKRQSEAQELAARCDVLSLHCAVNEQTTHMVNAEFLSYVKPGAILVNTARGQLVDNLAVRQALIDGRLGGIAIDTFDPEPTPADHPLVDLPPEVADRAVFSPHLGGITGGVFRRAHRNMWSSAKLILEGKRPNFVVNGL